MTNFLLAMKASPFGFLLLFYLLIAVLVGLLGYGCIRWYLRAGGETPTGEFQPRQLVSTQVSRASSTARSLREEMVEMVEMVGGP